MTRTLIALAASVFTSAQAADAPQLTVYSGDYEAVAQSQSGPGGPGYALLKQPLQIELGGDRTPFALSALPTALDASSVQLRPRGAAQVLGQRFDFALASEHELLQRAIGGRVSVEQSAGTTVLRHEGVLLAAGDGLTLRMDDGRLKRLAHYDSFELATMPEGLVAAPTLNWTLSGRGRQTFDLHYSTAGLAWRAEYQADLKQASKGCTMRLEGAAMLVNRSGADFDSVSLTLVAGQPNRVTSAGPEMVAMAAPRAKMVMADGAPSPEVSGEYHAYRLPGSAHLPQGSIQRLPLLDAANNVACERRYETGSRDGGWQPPRPIIDRNFGSGEGEQPVQARLLFQNRKADGLGLPLPAGRLRVFDDGELLGEAGIGHTAANREIDVVVGQAFDLSAERTREDFRLDRSGRQMEERIRVVVRNAKKEAATVRVLERMGRWNDWEIVASSHAHNKLDAQSAGFDLPVPAGGETTLSYTVRYRWPADVTLP
ncbi:MAG TPA: DUF4139 domain-containing protein [Arenimonas sp.]|nr:DUF4139 domain-containing protein [Arenimonas sp.]